MLTKILVGLFAVVGVSLVGLYAAVPSDGTTASGCCAPAAACCHPVSACCETEAPSCCTADATCCDADAACCETEKLTVAKAGAGGSSAAPAR